MEPSYAMALDTGRPQCPPEKGQVQHQKQPALLSKKQKQQTSKPPAGQSSWPCRGTGDAVALT